MSFSIGKIFGVKIKIHFTWFFIFALITWSVAAFYLPSQYPGLSVELYWILGAISAFLLFISVLIHELAHSYVAIKRGLSVPSITLYFFGGVSEIESEPSDPKTEASMSVVGPLTSFGIAGITALAWYIAVTFNLGAIVAAPLFYISLINLLLGAFNLLPAFPLDGGRVLRAGLWRWKKDLIPATKLANRISTIFSYALIVFGLFTIFSINFVTGLWLIFIGWFLKSGADQSLKQTIITQALSDIEVKDIMKKEVTTISSDKLLSEAMTGYFNVFKHGGFPVVQDQKILGVVTKEDIKKIPEEEWDKTNVQKVMTPIEKLVYVKPTDSAVEAFMKFSKHDVGRLPVLENEHLVGIVTRSDIFTIIRVRTEGEIKPS